MIKPLAELTSPRLLELLQWWEKARSPGVPLRRDFEPAFYPKLWPHLFICDVLKSEAGEFRFIYRYTGTEMDRNMKINCTGKEITELPIDNAINSISEEFLRTVEDRQPTYCEHKFVTDNNRFVHFVRLITPASIGGDSVDYLIGACEFLRAWEEDHLN